MRAIEMVCPPQGAGPSGAAGAVGSDERFRGGRSARFERNNRILSPSGHADSGHQDDADKEVPEIHCPPPHQQLSPSMRSRPD